MALYQYGEILAKAQQCQDNVKRTGSVGIPSWWGYYIAKAILSPANNFTVKTISNAPHPSGTSIHTKIYKVDYMDMCRRLVRWVDNNSNVMPNFIYYKNYRVSPDLFLEIASRILIFYHDYRIMPNYANADSDVFAKPKSYTSNESKNTKTICDTESCEEDYAYAMNIVQQANPNMTKLHTWLDTGNAISYNDKTYTKSVYTVHEDNQVIIPDNLFCADFGLNIPDDAYISRVRFEAKMRIDNSSTKVKAPDGHFMIYNGKGKVSSQTEIGQDGWYDGNYHDYAVRYLSTSWEVMTYTIYEEEFQKKKFPSSSLNNVAMGIDFHPNIPESISRNTNIEIAWVRIKVSYIKPSYHFSYGQESSIEAPYEMLTDEEYCIDLNLENTSSASGNDQTIDIELPYGTFLESYSPSNADITEIDDHHYQWEVEGKGFSKESLKLCLISKVFGFKTITSKLGDVEYPFYIYPYAEPQADYGELNIYGGTVQKSEPSCFKFASTVVSNDNSISFTVVVDGENQTNWSKVSTEFLSYYNNSNHGNCIVNSDDGSLGWHLDSECVANGVSINWSSTDNNTVTFNIPSGEEVEIKWTACFIPLTTGENTLYVVNGDTGDSYEYEYNSIAPKQTNIKTTFESVRFNDYRLLTQISSGAYYLPISAKVTDRVMIQQDCTLKAHFWENIAYIGCVPLETSHYDPKHQTTNSGLTKTYKNMTYMGKKMEVDESTSLHIKSHPHNWTTWKGLVELDKPIPVNAVPKLFEGDVLNHRGWAEITAIKNVTKTNPHYYDGEITLDYLTHNINSRFIIERGGKSFNVQSPSLMASVLDSGEEFANYTYVNSDGEIVTNPTGYFMVDTDGAYIYDSDMSEESRTIIGLDNKQYVEIKSENPFTENSSFTMRWHSTKIPENRENNIEREVYLLNEDDRVVFKYTYHDYEFNPNNEYYSCMVKGEKLIGNVWTECINKKLYLAVDVESLQLEVDEDGNIIQESDLPYDAVIPSDTSGENQIYEFNDYTYGSSLTFLLKGNVLDIVDTGMNGRQISEKGITLEEGKYKLQVIFRNNNVDSDTTDVLTFFDFEVSESILSSDYGMDYGNMYISSFPIVGKTLLFTRQSEDCTIYYFRGEDDEEFTYIQEPYYMYAGGVDLTAGDGQSIFNLNNSYSIFYMQNGLVRIGFNRINGELYISKYDLYAKRYINVARLECQNKDFMVGSYSDDKIQIVAGTTVYTMYRGHPYIIINHPDEDIIFETTWDKIFSEMLNGEAYQFPVYFDLLNHDNLLPILSSDDLITADDENTLVTTIPEISLTAPTDVYIDEPSLFSVSGTVSNIDDYLPIEIGRHNYTGTHGEYTFGLMVDNSIPKYYDFVSPTNTIQFSDVAPLVATVEDYAKNGIDGKTVKFYEIYTPKLTANSSLQIIQSGDTIDINGLFKDNRDNSILAIPNREIKFYETYNPRLDANASSYSLQDGDSISISASFKDSRDNSYLVVPNREIKFMGDYEVTDVNSVSVSSSANIVSYAHNGTCTISATILDSSNNPLASKSVRFYKNGVSLGTATTNSNGVASGTYTSSGDGDVVITAKCEGVSSNSVTIEDCLWYDSPSSDNSSSYTPALAEGGTYPSLSFDTDHYTYTKGSKTTMCYLDGVVLPTNCVIEADIKASGLGIGITDKSSLEGYVLWSNSHSAYRYTRGSWNSGTNFSTNSSCSNVWCHLKAVKTGNSVTVTVSNGTETVDYTKDLQSALQNTSLYFSIVSGSSLSGDRIIKHIKIKAL